MTEARKAMLFWMAGLSVYAAGAALCYTYWMRTARPEAGRDHDAATVRSSHLA
jgi:hypothetical protein